MEIFGKVKRFVKRVGMAIVALPLAIKIIAILIILVLTSTIFSWILEVTLGGNTPSAIYEGLEIEDVAELIQIKGNENTGYYLDFADDIDQKLEDIIETINTSGSYHDVPGDVDFLKKLIQAEVVTKFPNLGGEIPEGESGFQGVIDVKRVTPNKAVGEMKNTGQGETSVLEPESSYTDVSLTPREEEIQSWEEGKQLVLYNNAYVYEEEANVWIKKQNEDSSYVIINKSDEVTYTGNYEKVEDRLNDTVVFYIEVNSGDITGYIRSKDINIRSSGGEGEYNDREDTVDSNETPSLTPEFNTVTINPTNSAEMTTRTNATVSSRARDSSGREIIGEEGDQFTVAIAAGHNNTDDQGAASGDLIEEELTIQVAERVQELIESTYSNVTVVQTGSTSDNPGGIKVEDRTQLARDANPDLCIQIHFNAAESADANGVEVIYKEGDGYSQQLAEILSDSISSAMGLENRGAGADTQITAVGSLSIIENAASSGFPSVVTEGGFLTGNVDADVIRDDGVENYAQGIVNGIKTYLESSHEGLSATETGTTTITSSIESRVVNMKYVTPEEFEELKASGNVEEATKYFTLNEDNKLVSLTWTLSNDGSVEIKENAAMDFRTALQNYHMPFEYLLFYYIDTGYEDFSLELADIVLDSEIVIALQDNITTTETLTDLEVKVETSSNEGNAAGAAHDWQVDSSQHTRTITETCNTKTDITYIETWCVKTYKENSYSERVLNMGDQDEIIVNVPGQVTYTEGTVTRGEEQIVAQESRDTGLDDEDGNNIMYTYTEIHRTATTVNRLTNTYDSGGDMKVEPMTDKYVDLYIEEHMNKRMQEYWFFKLLEDNEKTANLLDLTKYLMFLASNTDYGVTEFDFEDTFGEKSFSSVSGIYGSTPQEKVWFALLDAGYSKEAAAGVLGNIQAESGFDSSVIEAGNGIGFGLCQWSYGRRTQLESYAASKGADPGDINIQIEFLLGEITPGGGADGYATYQLMNNHGYTADDWINASTPEAAAEAFCWIFERPGVVRMDVITEAARDYYEQLKDLEKPIVAGGDVLTVCEQVMNDMIARNVHYSVNDLTWGDIEAAAQYPYACCATYVSIVLYQSGLLTADQINAFNYNYTGTGGIPDMLSAAGWTQVSHDEIQPGDVINDVGNHVLIYAGDGLVYDQNCGVVSSSGRAPLGGPYSAWFSRYYGNANVQVWRSPNNSGALDV